MTVNISQKRNIEHFTTWQLGTNFFPVIMLVSLCPSLPTVPALLTVRTVLTVLILSKMAFTLTAPCQDDPQNTKRTPHLRHKISDLTRLLVHMYL
jgi:hypothetical protein